MNDTCIPVLCLLQLIALVLELGDGCLMLLSQVMTRFLRLQMHVFQKFSQLLKFGIAFLVCLDYVFRSTLCLIQSI
jgi:hypothetical protein